MNFLPTLGKLLEENLLFVFLAAGFAASFVVNLIILKRVKKIRQQNKEVKDQLNYAIKMASIGTMVSGISYELNSPTTSLLGYVHSLKRLVKSDDEQIKKNLEKMEDATARMEKVLKRLRSMGTYATGNEKNFGVNQAIINSVFFLETRFKEENIELRLDLADDIYLIYGQMDRFEEMVQQVLLNSLVAFSKNNKRNGKIKLTLRKVDGHLNKVKLTIKDNAGGISEDLIENIFSPVISKKNDDDTEGEMTGVGLSQVKETAIRHRGNVYVNSRKEQTEFSFIFPISGVDKRSVIDLGEEVKKRETDNQIRVPYIVAVDDQEEIGEIIQIYLEGKTNVKSFQDPTTVLEKTKNIPIDVLITDNKMPNMTGVQLAGSMKSYLPNLKVILITGHDQDLVSLKSKYAYIDEVIFKPFDKKELLEAVNKVISSNEKLKKVA